MDEYQFILEPYKGMNTRYPCPNPLCKGKTFVRYIDTRSGEHIHSNVGRCNRESKCGYHFTPKQYFYDNNISFQTPCPKQSKKSSAGTLQPKSLFFIPFDIFKNSLKSHDTNNFINFLIDLFGVQVTKELIGKYFIGTSKYWNGATVFWQIDTMGMIRTGKIMLYSPITGKRVKEPYNHITWAHKVLKQSGFDLKQCLFGEHLLLNNEKHIALVESEKTAIISSVYLPQFIWLAVGSLTNLNAEKCSILKGRTITLFPDLNGFEKWSNKAKELSHPGIFNVSNLLEIKATEAEKKQGFDLADYLIQFDYKQIAFPETGSAVKSDEMLRSIKLSVKTNPFNMIELTDCFTNSEIDKLENWNQDILELETFFTGIELPTHQIKLTQCSTITNVSLFIESHMVTVRAQNGKRAYLPYLERLIELKKTLTKNLN